MKHRLVVGIDPDIKLTGMAVWDQLYKNYLLCETFAFEHIHSELNMLINQYRCAKSDVIIYLEAGWKNDKANFRRGQKSNVSENIAMRVGMNHATSMLLGRVLRKEGWNVIEIAPIAKGPLKNLRGWTDSGRKWIEDRTGLKKLNDEKRCALYIVEAFKLR